MTWKENSLRDQAVDFLQKNDDAGGSLHGVVNQFKLMFGFTANQTLAVIKYWKETKRNDERKTKTTSKTISA